MFGFLGNHDWYDGLHSFVKFICDRPFLGGWLLPQRRSYFVLKLPHDWWIFGVDNGLACEMDAEQFKYFASVAAQLSDDAAVIVVTHDPNWVNDSYFRDRTNKLLEHLCRTLLRGKLALRIAGDLHHYTRHMAVRESKSTFMGISTAACHECEPDLVPTGSVLSSRKPKTTATMRSSLSTSDFDVERRRLMEIYDESPSTSASRTRANSDAEESGADEASIDRAMPDPNPPVLVVSGGGGAFLHSTHGWQTGKTIAVRGTGYRYERKVVYPSKRVSLMLGWRNLFQFRKRNMGFDLIGGVLYFLIVYSLFPLCHCRYDLDAVLSATGLSQKLVLTADIVFLLMSDALLNTSHVSLATTAGLWVFCIVFVERGKLRNWQRLVVGSLHFACHLFSAISLLVVIELILEAGTLRPPTSLAPLLPGRRCFFCMFSLAFATLWSTLRFPQS
jgi:hypothetical protein